jgi:hypothetical protein
VQVVDGSNWQLRLSGNIGQFHEWFFHMNLLAERLSLCTSLTLLQTDDSWIWRERRLRFLLFALKNVSKKVLLKFRRGPKSSEKPKPDFAIHVIARIEPTA